MQKVQSGQTLRIPAETFKAFLDAARDFHNWQRSVSTESQPAVEQPNLCSLLEQLCALKGTDETEFELAYLRQRPGDQIERTRKHRQLVREDKVWNPLISRHVERRIQDLVQDQVRENLHILITQHPAPRQVDDQDSLLLDEFVK